LLPEEERDDVIASYPLSGLGLLAAVLALVFLAYLQPSFMLELGSRLQLC
jgi:hypothetical protein